MKDSKHAVVLGVTKSGKRFLLGMGDPTKMQKLHKTTDGKKDKDSAITVFYLATAGKQLRPRKLKKPGGKLPPPQPDNPNPDAEKAAAEKDAAEKAAASKGDGKTADEERGQPAKSEGNKQGDNAKSK